MPGAALYIAFDVYPRPKGASSHIASMLGALAGEFESVHALCLGDREMPVTTREGNIVIHRLLAGMHVDFLDRVTAFAQFVTAQVAALGPRLRLIVFRDPWGGAAAMRAVAGVPTIFEVNALPSWELGYARPGMAESPTFAAKLGDLERLCLSRANGILCVSGVTRRALANEGFDASKMQVIPNSAPDECFSPASCIELPEGDWIGYVGGLQPWQGVESLIDAFALLAPGHPQARLLIAHSGSRDARALERRIADRGLASRVLLHDPLPISELAATIARMRCTVAPLADTPRNTHQGCCPVKIVESMAVGTPVVATDLEVCRELITHGDDGWLVKRGDIRALALGLERLLTDDELRGQLADDAKSTARERFGRANTHVELRRVFRSVAASRNGAETWRAS